MNGRARLVATCAALVFGAGLASPAFAGQKVPQMAAAEPLWWYDGFAEVGGRFDMNNPNKNTLGKFYEYRDLRPGVFGNFFFGAHRVDGLFDFDVWGKNVGWDDQAYGLDLSQPGAYYLTFGWDETPHVYSQDAKTTFGPIGGSVLTTPYYGAPPPTAATQAFVTANSTVFDLGFRRDTASASFRWTPTDNWDVSGGYSHMHRHGTQPTSIVSFTTPVSRGAGTRDPIELPKPLDDTTQNGNVKGEYAGSTPWGKPFNVAFGYGISVYSNDIDSLSFQNPWNAVNSATFPLWNRYSLAPDNQAQSLSVSGGVGLPFNSRYMGTFQYSMMTQDDPFLPSTINPLVPLATLTASSLNGDARTVLSNNVLNTQITPTLKSVLRYRYYDYHSRQMPITITGLFANPDTNAGAEGPLTPIPINFTKQNASADLVWRALDWLTIGPGYAFERWQRGSYADVPATDENIAKLFADANWGWSTWRTSFQYGMRRYEDPYVNRTANNNAAIRVMEYADRDRTQVTSSWAIQVTNNIAFTPNGGIRYDDYLTDPFQTATEIGLLHDNSWNAGADLAWSANHSVALYVSYNHEDGYRQIYQNNANPGLDMQTRDKIDTFIVGTKITLIPDTLFLDANYTYSRSRSAWTSDCTTYGCLNSPQPVFPVAHNTLNRLDTQLKYMFDESVTRNAGFMGRAFVKFRVLWERNNSDNWQPLSQQLGWAVNPGDNTMARSVFLATGNPNYDVVLGQVSAGLKW
jgi:MtrB/PioB family decaheme-associated outer membrane protein